LKRRASSAHGWLAEKHQPLAGEAPTAGVVIVFHAQTMSRCPKTCRQISLVLWYIAYKDVHQAVLVEIKQNNAPWEGKLANIVFTIAAVAEHRADGCRSSYQRELPHNDCDDCCGPRAPQAGILRHVYRNFVW
jgi:hypothetical protein